MSSYFYSNRQNNMAQSQSSHHHQQQQHQHSHQHQHQHQHHGGRRRNNRQVKAVREKQIVETINMAAFRRDFEAARSFDLEDDEIFCPFNLLTEDDLHSINSSGSDRSSLSSGSPEQSPLQHQVQPPSFLLSNTPSFAPSSGYPPQQQLSQPKLHQPMAQRAHRGIPIVDPSTRAVASPPPSVSPARQMQPSLMARRW